MAQYGEDLFNFLLRKGFVNYKGLQSDLNLTYHQANAKIQALLARGIKIETGGSYGHKKIKMITNLTKYPAPTYKAIYHEKILSLLSDGKIKRSSEIYKELNFPSTHTCMALGRLCKLGKINKLGLGKYQIAKSNQSSLDKISDQVVSNLTENNKNKDFIDFYKRHCEDMPEEFMDEFYDLFMNWVHSKNGMDSIINTINIKKSMNLSVPLKPKQGVASNG